MAQTNTINTKWLQRVVMVYAFIMLAGLIFLESRLGTTTIFKLHFNPFALLSLASVLVNLSFVFIVLTRRTKFRSEEVTWYLLFLCTLIAFAFFEMMQRLSVTPHGALFWAQLGGIGPAFESVGLFMFVVLYVNRRDRSITLMPLIIMGAALLLFFHGNGGLVFQTKDSAIKHYAWGYNNDVGDAFGLNILWGLGPGALAIGILYRFSKRTRNQILKHQAQLFALAISIPLVGAILFDSLAPAVGLKLPPLHDVFTIATAGLVLYGLSHYRVFEVTPASLASDILTTMSESVVVVNDQLQIELLNESAEKIFGEKSKRLAGITITDLFDSLQGETIRQSLAQVIIEGERYPVGQFVLTKNNTKAYVKVTASKITEEHGNTGYTLVLTDVTELQKSYDALEDEKDSVERKVEERTRELHEAQERLAETDKIKTEFVVLTSHNLRTPLTKIRGNVELLDESGLNATQKTYLTTLRSSTERLGNLIEELLTISSIEAGTQTKLDLVKLNDILSSVKEEAHDLAKASHNKFTFDNSTEGVTIKANSARLQTAIHNLLDNAFKFTKNGKIKLEISADRRQVVIKVIDDGIGITADELPKLFTKFHKSSTNNVFVYDYEGEGVGLYLTKLIVEEHGGQINVTSLPKKGTTFIITLPRANA